MKIIKNVQFCQDNMFKKNQRHFSINIEKRQFGYTAFSGCEVFYGDKLGVDIIRVYSLALDNALTITSTMCKETTGELRANIVFLPYMYVLSLACLKSRYSLTFCCLLAVVICCLNLSAIFTHRFACADLVLLDDDNNNYS